MDLETARRIVASMPDASLRAGIEEMARIDPMVWSAYYRKLRGQPLVFDNSKNLTEDELKKAKAASKNRPSYNQDVKARLLRHRPFLIDPMRDQHPHKVYMKARQMGVSEISFMEAVWFLTYHSNTKWIVTFPRDSQLKKFVATRIDPAFEETPRMKALLGTPNQIYLKRIRDAYLVLGSAWESNLGEGVDADGVTLDEKDRMNVGVEGAFIESLKSSKWGFLREVSTPTLPDRGVALTYGLSDQREWLIKCSKCGLEQEVEYPTNIVQVKDIKGGSKELEEGTYEYLCRLEKCRGLLDRMRGRWVARKPSVQNIRGYHMSHANCPWISATELMQSKINLRFPEMWFKYDLGLPAMGDTTLLGEQDYEMACAGHELIYERTSDWTDIAAGIDWGNLNWIVVTGRNVHNGRLYLLSIGIFEDDPRDPLVGSAKAAEHFLTPFSPDIIIADDGYGKDRNAYLLKKFDGSGTRFFASRYSPAPKNSRQFQPVWNDDGAQVLVDRTMWLKMTCRAIKEGEMGLPSYESHEGALLKDHLRSLVPMRESDEDGDIYETIASRSDDHLAHSLLYCMLGQEYLSRSARFGFNFLG